MGSGRGPITQSLQTNCTLESTLSRIFLLLELRYLGGGGSFISRKNTRWRSRNTLKKLLNFPRFSLLLKYFRAASMWRKR